MALAGQVGIFLAAAILIWLGPVDSGWIGNWARTLG